MPGMGPGGFGGPGGPGPHGGPHGHFGGRGPMMGPMGHFGGPMMGPMGYFGFFGMFMSRGKKTGPVKEGKLEPDRYVEYQKHYNKSLIGRTENFFLKLFRARR